MVEDIKHDIVVILGGNAVQVSVPNRTDTWPVFTTNLLQDNGYPVISNWEFKDRDGMTLDRTKPFSEYSDKGPFYLSLSAGVGG